MFAPGSQTAFADMLPYLMTTEVSLTHLLTYLCLALACML